MKKGLVLLIAGLMVLNFTVGVLADPTPLPFDEKHMLMVFPK